jgi:hypothetical protein
MVLCRVATKRQRQSLLCKLFLTIWENGGDMVIRIKSVAPKEDYRLQVELDNGSSIVLNLESRLSTIRFGLLSDKEFFKKVSTDGICISWEGKIEISLSEIFQLAQK